MKRMWLASAAAVIALPLLGACGDTGVEADDPIARGRYLTVIGACNDCHTPGYEDDGHAPDEVWLTGTDIGWRGPWGTTYAVNLRRYMAALSEPEWLEVARTMQPRPPMPWFNVRAMTDADLIAIYRFVRSLGPAGEPAPAYLPPDQEPPPPFILFP